MRNFFETFQDLFRSEIGQSPAESKTGISIMSGIEIVRSHGHQSSMPVEKLIPIPTITPDHDSLPTKKFNESRGKDNETVIYYVGINMSPHEVYDS